MSVNAPGVIKTDWLWKVLIVVIKVLVKLSVTYVLCMVINSDLAFEGTLKLSRMKIHIVL